MIRYHNGTEYNKIAFTSGCYSYSELSDYIRELLIENGNMKTDGDSPIEIEFDLTSLRCLVIIMRGVYSRLKR